MMSAGVREGKEKGKRKKRKKRENRERQMSTLIEVSFQLYF